MLNNDSEIIAKFKDKLAKNNLYINDFEQVNCLLYDENSCNKYIVFNKISYKNYFLENTTKPVINCNTSYDKFIEDMENVYSYIAVFNNIGCCTDVRILDIIDKTKNLRIE